MFAIHKTCLNQSRKKVNYEETLLSYRSFCDGFCDALVYGGASAGQSDLGGESSTSYNVHVGTGILPFIALEAGFQDFGEFKNATYDNVKRDLQASTVYFAVKPSMDFGPLHVYARAGLPPMN